MVQEALIDAGASVYLNKENVAEDHYRTITCVLAKDELELIGE
jgi:hypothetical protein